MGGVCVGVGGGGEGGQCPLCFKAEKKDSYTKFSTLTLNHGKT